MKYLSLYKTSSEHSADNSRLVPNISLITDEKKMILTNENNINTEFEKVDIIESFDDLINRFPSGNSSHMHGIKIYGDNTDQSKAKNIKLLNDAQEYISNSSRSIVHVDALIIDNIIMDQYDGNYQYSIIINNNHSINLNYRDGEVLTINYDGSVGIYMYNIFPSSTETVIPDLRIDTIDYNYIYNIKLYNNAQEWRNSYISNNGLSDTGQGIYVHVDELMIDNTIIDKYDRYYHYYIKIYNDHIDLENNGDHERFLTIYGDGSVDVYVIPTPTPDSDITTMTPTPTPDSDTTTTLLPIFNFNEFPPTPSDTVIPGVKIYTDDSYQSKANNIELYNNAQEYRNNSGYSDPNVPNDMNVDALIIDDETIDEYDDHYKYGIDVYRDFIRLIYNNNQIEILDIYSDGSVRQINPIPSDSTTTTTTTKHPHI